MQLHSGCRPTVGGGQVVRNAESATVGPALRSQDLTIARHFRRSLRTDFGRMSTFARQHHSPLCSCIVGADQPLVTAELSAMRSPQPALFRTNRQNAPGLHSPTWGNAGALSIRTKPAGPEVLEGPGNRPSTPADRKLVAQHLGDEEGQLEGLLGVEAGVAGRLVAAGQVDVGDVLGAAEALGDVLAGELDVDAARVGA